MSGLIERMVHWLDERRRKGSGPAVLQPTTPPEPEELDVGTAIESHQDWKLRLEAAIRSGSLQDLDPALIGREDGCALGRWIVGPGATQFAGDPNFADLRAKHASFHRCAERAVVLGQAGKRELALGEMSSCSGFASCSWQVIGDLAAMLTQAGASAQETPQRAHSLE